MKRTIPAELLSGVNIGNTIHHHLAGKADYSNFANVTRPGFAKITMITHTKNGSVIVRTDADQQNLKFAPGTNVTIEVKRHED